MKKQIQHLAYYLFHTYTNNKFEKPSIFYRPYFLKKCDQVYYDKNEIFDIYTVTFEKNNNINDNNIENLIKKYNFPFSQTNNLLILYENEIIKHIYIVNSNYNQYITTIKHENNCFSIYEIFRKKSNLISHLLNEQIEFKNENFSNISQNNLILSILCEEIKKCVFIIIPTQYKYFDEFYKFLNTHFFSFIKFKDNIITPELFFYFFLKEKIQPQ